MGGWSLFPFLGCFGFGFHSFWQCLCGLVLVGLWISLMAWWGVLVWREFDSIDACRSFDVTCGWVGGARFGSRGTRAFGVSAIFLQRLFLLQRLF